MTTLPVVFDQGAAGVTPWPVSVTGVSTAAKQDDLLVALGALLTELQQKLESGGTVALDVPTLAALETITASVSNFPVEYPLPAAQVTTLTPSAPQTDALTDTELRATPVPISGTVAVSNHPAQQTDALTDTQLRATPVPVSGPLTDAQVRATPLPVSGTVTVGSLPEVEVKNDTGSPLTVKDDFTTAGHAADQTGAGAVLTFSMTAGSLVMVDVDPTSSSDYSNYRARATVDGTTPTATLGFVCRPGTSYLPIPTAGTVKVYAPTGVTVAVQVMSR